jgi:hypothetical protein
MTATGYINYPPKRNKCFLDQRIECMRQELARACDQPIYPDLTLYHQEYNYRAIIHAILYWSGKRDTLYMREVNDSMT